MIIRMWCNLKWNLFKFKQQFIEDCMDLLCPGYVAFSKALVDDYLNLKHKYWSLRWELEGALQSLEEAHKRIGDLSKRKRRKK